MPIPLIADPNDVMTDLGYDTSMTNITNAANSALRMATVSLASAMQTDFKQGVVTDTYYVDAPTDRRSWNEFTTEFRLSQAFVNASPAFQAIYAYTQPQLSIPAYSSNTSTAFTVDLEKGVATDNMNHYARNWVQLTYTKGFPLGQAPAQGSPQLFDLTVVPAWLQECATILAKIALQSNPALEDPAIKMDTKLLQQQLQGILKPHLRYTPSAKLPSSTTMFGPEVLATATLPSPLPGGLDPALVLPFGVGFDV